MKKIWDEQVECIGKEDLKAMQSERLVACVKRMWEDAPYYRAKMEEMGVTPDDITGVDDLHKLPFTVKTDLRDNYPYGMFAVPMDDVVRIHASSGTTGKQIVVGYTQNDLDIWDECVVRCLTTAGVTHKDKIHVAYGYGLFTGGLGLHGGAQKLGATVIPASSGNTKRQITLLKDLKATVLCCTPSYALHLADEMYAMGLTKDDLELRVGVFGAEPWSEEMRNEIENKLGLKAYDIYGLSETMGPGVAIDCDARAGLHFYADHFIMEIIDPETGEVLPDGSEGELVISSVTKEALPILRYRTRDLSRIFTDKCECGRTIPRIQKITGRSDDMLIIRGVNVFPSQIESILLQFKEVEPHYQIIVDRRDNTDVMEVKVELSPELFTDEVKDVENLATELKKAIDSTLGLSVKVSLVEYRSLPRSEGKAKRVIDNRKIF